MVARGRRGRGRGHTRPAEVPVSVAVIGFAVVGAVANGGGGGAAGLVLRCVAVVGEAGPLHGGRVQGRSGMDGRTGLKGNRLTTTVRHPLPQFIEEGKFKSFLRKSPYPSDFESQNSDVRPSLPSRAFDVDGDGNVDLYDRSRIDHHVYDYIDDDDGDGDESVEGISPPVEGARRLDTFGDDILVYEVRPSFAPYCNRYLQFSKFRASFLIFSLKHNDSIRSDSVHSSDEFTRPVIIAGHLPEAGPLANTTRAAEARQGAGALPAGAVRAAAAAVAVPPQPDQRQQLAGNSSGGKFKSSSSPSHDGDVGVQQPGLLPVAAADGHAAASTAAAEEAAETQGRLRSKFPRFLERYSTLNVERDRQL